MREQAHAAPIVENRAEQIANSGGTFGGTYAPVGGVWRCFVPIPDVVNDFGRAKIAFVFNGIVGRSGGIRTHDPLSPRQVR